MSLTFPRCAATWSLFRWSTVRALFPGDREGSEAERLAHMLFEVFIRNADAYIDLHCGDGYETLIPYCYYLGDAPAEAAAKRMVACVNVKYVVRSHCRTGGAYNLASLHGVPSVLIERGQLSLFSREEIEADKADVRSILRRLGVLDGDWTRYPKQELLEYNDDAPCTGCWYPEKKPGDCFRKGEKLGETISAKASLRSSHPQTGCCCIRPRR